MSKILVVGGTGLIGSKVVPMLQAIGKKVEIASPSKGVNTITGQGLAEALKGVDTVVDVSNAPADKFADKKSICDFFQTSTSNIVREAKIAGIKHLVALSIVGVHKMPDLPYMAAKLIQENLIKESGIPYTIVRATQFFEFLEGITQASTKGQEVLVTSRFVQPIASEDVSAAVTNYTLVSPLNTFVNVAGPQKFRMDEIVAKFLSDLHDSRKAVGNPDTEYFGAKLTDDYMLTLNKEENDGTTYKINYDTWFANSKFAKKA